MVWPFFWILIVSNPAPSFPRHLWWQRLPAEVMRVSEFFACVDTNYHGITKADCRVWHSSWQTLEANKNPAVFIQLMLVQFWKLICSWVRLKGKLCHGMDEKGWRGATWNFWLVFILSNILDRNILFPGQLFKRASGSEALGPLLTLPDSLLRGNTGNCDLYLKPV